MCEMDTRDEQPPTSNVRMEHIYKNTQNYENIDLDPLSNCIKVADILNYIKLSKSSPDVFKEEFQVCKIFAH